MIVFSYWKWAPTHSFFKLVCLNKNSGYFVLYVQAILFLRETYYSSEHFEDGHLNKSENPNLGPFSCGDLFSPNDVSVPFTFLTHQYSSYNLHKGVLGVLSIPLYSCTVYIYRHWYYTYICMSVTYYCRSADSKSMSPLCLPSPLSPHPCGFYTIKKSTGTGFSERSPPLPTRPLCCALVP